MKKFLPYILILTVIVQLFAPFNVGNSNKSDFSIVKESKAEAAETACKTLEDYKKAFSASTLSFNGSIVNKETEDTSVDMHIKIDPGVETLGGNALPVWLCVEMSGNSIADKSFVIVFQDKNTKEAGYFDLAADIRSKTEGGLTSREWDKSFGTTGSGITSITGLDKFKPNTEYTASIYYQAYTGTLLSPSPANDKGVDILGNNNSDYFLVTNTNFSTATVEQGFNGQTGTGEVTTGKHSFLPACNILNGSLSWLTGDGTLMGCVVQLFYYVAFVPTSWIFGFTGTLLDTTVHFSIQDSSYRSAFVVEGWKIVRDFCNMFFIFVLLYIAFGTILKVHAVKTQEMIVNVVIIGLLINFSLFATQVIIDASNILTRVFYNSSAIKITEKGANWVTENTPRLKVGPNGEIPISAAIVNKINPQNLIMKGMDKIEVSSDTTGESGSTNSDGGIGIGSWIILILMATIVNVVGIITFLSSSLIFITRVIGLWLAMIFAPLAFFSYIIPQLQDTKMIGWKKWWPDTLKMAFLAPIFTFFLYIIIAFLDTGLGLVSVIKFNGLTYFVSIIIPLIFIMLLLMKAKDVAKDMSGELGQSITKGIASLGGAALGVGALGIATIGRGAGNIYGKMANSKASENRFNHKIEFNKQLEKWEGDKKKGLAVGPKPKWGDYVKGVKAKGEKVNTWNPLARMGTALSMAQRKTNKVDEAREHSNADIEKAGFKGMKWQNMSAEQRNIVREKVRKENYTKFSDDAEREYRRLHRDEGLEEVDDKGKLRDLNANQKEEIKNLAKSKAVDKFEEEINKATEGVNAFTRVFSKTNTGSYDIRKLATANVDKNASIFTKIPVGLIAGVATGVRSGILKSAGLSNGGVKVEGKFLDDLKSVLKDSLKNIKVELPESHDHGGGKQVGHGDSGGGHH